MSRLPDGWTLAPIGDICSLLNGRAFKASEWKISGIPIIRIQNLNSTNAPYNFFQGELESKHLVQPGELLFAWSGTPGTSFGAHVWNGPPAALNQHIFRVIFNSRAVDRDFFRYAINSKLQELIDRAQGGVGLAHVTKGKFEATLVPLPPLPEQHRIMAKVEKLMARSCKAREVLNDLPNLLKQYRQSLIHSAVMGELTTGWKSTQSQEPWEEVTVGDLIQGKPRNGYSPVAVDFETSVKSLSLSATTSGYFRAECFKYINEDIPNESHLWLEAGDVLIQRANTIELVGVSAIYNGPSKTYIYPDLMMKCRTNSRVLPEYLHLVLSSGRVRAFFREKATGTAGNMPKINQQTVISAPVFLPSIKEQREILRRVGVLLAHADQSTLSLVSAQNQIQSLNHSILTKAFRGELVPQDPNDEPADVLLARIRAEREASPAPARRGRGGPTQSKPQRPAVGPRPVLVPDPTATPRPSPSRSKAEDLEADTVLPAFRQALAAQARWGSDEDLLRAVAQRLGYERLGSRVKEVLRGLLRAALLRRIAERQEDGSLSSGPRTLDAYSRDELIEVIPSVLRKGQGLDRDDLMRAILQHLAFQRLTEPAQEALKSALNGAIRRGVIEVSGPNLVRRIP